jgi:hypothetical protein
MTTKKYRNKKGKINRCGFRRPGTRVMAIVMKAIVLSLLLLFDFCSSSFFLFVFITRARLLKYTWGYNDDAAEAKSKDMRANKSRQTWFWPKALWFHPATTLPNSRLPISVTVRFAFHHFPLLFSSTIVYTAPHIIQCINALQHSCLKRQWTGSLHLQLEFIIWNGFFTRFEKMYKKEKINWIDYRKFHCMPG